MLFNCNNIYGWPNGQLLHNKLNYLGKYYLPGNYLISPIG